MLAPTLDATLAWSPVFAAFGAAITGSLHCVGMCGPLRLIAGNSWRKRAAYQLGRGLAYALLGGLAGAVGWVVPPWALVALVALGLALPFFGGKMPARWQKSRSSLLAAASLSPFLFGFSSGLLPCGMLHAWLAAAAATASPLVGACLLAVLWLGTLPALELSGSVLAGPILLARKRFPRLVPASFLLLALIPFFLRNPFPQPENPAGGSKPMNCLHSHH